MTMSINCREVIDNGHGIPKKWPQDGEVYYNAFNGEFAVVDCMGENLTFYTSERDSRRVMDTYMFIAEFEKV